MFDRAMRYADMPARTRMTRLNMEMTTVAPRQRSPMQSIEAGLLIVVGVTMVVVLALYVTAP